MGENGFDSPRASVVNEDGGAETRYVGGEGDTKGVLQDADVVILDVVGLGPKDLGMVYEDPGIRDVDTTHAVLITAHRDGQG